MPFWLQMDSSEEEEEILARGGVARTAERGRPRRETAWRELRNGPPTAVNAIVEIGGLLHACSRDAQVGMEKKVRQLEGLFP